MLHLPDAQRCRPLCQPLISLFVLTVIWKTLQQEGEHWTDFTFRQERQGHEFTYILVCAIVMTVLVLESKLLNLKKKPANY